MDGREKLRYARRYERMFRKTKKKKKPANETRPHYVHNVYIEVEL